MHIIRIETEDYLVFKGKFAADFCPGVNVIIGGNGTGKTTLIKKAYKLLKPHLDGIKLFYDDESRGLGLLTYDTNGRKSETQGKNNKRKSVNQGEDTGGVVISKEDTFYTIYIPEKDILEHAKGFLALNNERNMPFDDIYIDILSKAEIPETREITPNALKLLDKIKNIIDGEVIYDNDEFFIKKTNGDLVAFTLEASGYKKFGLLWKLLRNGLLENGTVLFWDEPENSLNPELLPVLVDILLELSRNGVQVFAATHSEILASYFAANRQKDDSVMFHSLFKDGEKININSSDRFDLLEPNNLTAETVKLYEKEVEVGLG